MYWLLRTDLVLLCDRRSVISVLEVVCTECVVDHVWFYVGVVTRTTEVHWFCRPVQTRRFREYGWRRFRWLDRCNCEVRWVKMKIIQRLGLVVSLNLITWMFYIWSMKSWISYWSVFGVFISKFVYENPKLCMLCIVTHLTLQVFYYCFVFFTPHLSFIVDVFYSAVLWIILCVKWRQAYHIRVLLPLWTLKWGGLRHKKILYDRI